MNRDIYQAITQRFIEKLKQGTVPWQQPWTSSVQNIVSRKPYRGINAFMLGMSERTSPFWLTFKQATDLGGRVRKGEKSLPVIYFKLLDRKDAAGNPVLREDGQTARIPFARWANVFNLDQTEGIEAPAILTSTTACEPLENAEAIVSGAKLCPIVHSGFAAAYFPKEDEIRLPAPANFRSMEDYYQTLFHEMTHATGHVSRLNREAVNQPIKFGSDQYSKEELVAELGAAFLANEAGTLDQVQFNNSAAYLSSWVRKLEDDPKLIVSAASHAQRSADFVLGVDLKNSISDYEHSSGEGDLRRGSRELDARETQRAAFSAGIQRPNGVFPSAGTARRVSRTIGQHGGIKL